MGRAVQYGRVTHPVPADRLRGIAVSYFPPSPVDTSRRRPSSAETGLVGAGIGLEPACSPRWLSRVVPSVPCSPSVRGALCWVQPPALPLVSSVGAVAHRDYATSLALWRRRLRVKTTIRRDDGTGRPSPDRPLSTSQPIWPKR